MLIYTTPATGSRCCTDDATALQFRVRRTVRIYDAPQLKALLILDCPLGAARGSAKYQRAPQIRFS
jgi:hypothetical protein